MNNLKYNLKYLIQTIKTIDSYHMGRINGINYMIK